MALLQRAISSGEISRAEAEQEKGRISLDDIGEGQPLTGEDKMPEALKELVGRSLKLHERILTLDVMIAEQDETLLTGEAANEVNTHIDMIQKAFNAKRG
jgi:regulator of CtrA degradation